MGSEAKPHVHICHNERLGELWWPGHNPKRGPYKVRHRTNFLPSVSYKKGMTAEHLAELS
jgi:hypothetical protein